MSAIPVIVIRGGPFDFTINGIQQSSIFDAMANGAATATQLHDAFLPWYQQQQVAIAATISGLNAQVAAAQAKESAHITAMTEAITKEDWDAVKAEMTNFGQTAKQKALAAAEAQLAQAQAAVAALS
jgi:hypothetical protein